MRLRKFLTLLTRVKNFEELYNLNRNAKYRINEIHWEATFFLLNSDVEKSETNFHSSKRKAMKIKFFIEELSTIEQMKKSLLSIYDGWMCPICGITEEIFNHIWICPGNIDKVKDIKEDAEIELMSLLYDFSTDDKFLMQVWLEMDKYHLYVND